VCDLLDAEIPLGDIDIAFYRDDLRHARGARRRLLAAAFRLEDYTVGPRRRRPLHRAARCAPRSRRSSPTAGPARVQLAVLADRGPPRAAARPDYVGKNLPTVRGERVNVRVAELDGVDEVASRRQEAG
jgi:pyrimidine operon attenuation protein/uracil phosphoribosyltransferase